MQPNTTAPIEVMPEPTFATLPGVASVNGVYADYNCCEEDGRHHKKHKGESLEGIEGWGLDDDGVPVGQWWQANEETGEQL